MRGLRIVGFALACTLVSISVANPALGPEARAGRERLVVSTPHARGRAKGAPRAAGLRDPARRLGAGHPQAAEPGLRRPRPALGHRAPSNIPTRRAQGTKPRDSVKILSDFQANGRAGKIETFADGLNIPIGLLPLAVVPRGTRPQHPQHLPDAGYRRRRPGRRARGALRRLRQSRHPRDDQRLHLGLRRLDLRLPRLLQRLEGRRAATIGRSA